MSCFSIALLTRLLYRLIFYRSLLISPPSPSACSGFSVSLGSCHVSAILQRRKWNVLLPFWPWKAYWLSPWQDGTTRPLLRVLALDTSITWGTNSILVNGYSKAFRSKMRFLMYEVNRIGCLAEGNFKDNQSEGYLILAIMVDVECSLNQNPKPCPHKRRH